MTNDHEAERRPAITQEDVRAALGDMDPDKTNAAALREILGRGSLATIQKFLKLERLERKRQRIRAAFAAKADQPTEIPEPPQEAVAALWHAAWTAAHASVLQRMDALVQERDAARAQLQERIEEAEALAKEVEELEEWVQKQDKKLLEKSNKLVAALAQRDALQAALRGRLQDDFVVEEEPEEEKPAAGSAAG